jgi:hypothetical protein
MYPLRRCCSDPLSRLVADSGVGAGWSQISSEIRHAVQTPCRPRSPYPKPPLRGHELARSRDPRLAATQWETGQAVIRAGFWEAAAPLLERAAAREPWDDSLGREPCRIRRPDYLALSVHDPYVGMGLIRHAAPAIA